MKIGDIVMIIDDNLEGQIVSFDSNIVLVETSEGFQIPFKKDELVVLENPIPAQEFFTDNISFFVISSYVFF